MEGLAVTVSRFAGFCFLPDIDEQRGYDGVSGALVPAFRKELDVSLGLLPPRGFEAKNDKGACAHDVSPRARVTIRSSARSSAPLLFNRYDFIGPPDTQVCSARAAS